MKWRDACATSVLALVERTRDFIEWSGVARERCAGLPERLMKAREWSTR